MTNAPRDRCSMRKTWSQPCGPGALEQHRWVKVVDVPGGQFDLCLPGSCRCQGEGLAEGLKAEGRKGGMEREAGPGGEKAQARNRRTVCLVSTGSRAPESGLLGHARACAWGHLSCQAPAFLPP